ncbi:hypothetical protein QQX98_007949 [Neonectria punicea]|uniref:Uncharacterized protein n=1 Tax=Neonectria punicea TaxID=979145 RepID=A0ABR1GWG9_9HYPO
MAASYAPTVSSSGICETTTTLPVITASSDGGSTKYVQSFTTVYLEFCPEGLRPETYTITETCTKTLCQPHTSTVLPPGFTQATVVCSNCGSQGPMTEALTFPSQAIASYSALGYKVLSTSLSNSAATQASPSDSGSQPDIKSNANTGSNSESNPGVTSHVATSTNQITIVTASSGTSDILGGSDTPAPVPVAAAAGIRPGIIILGAISITSIALQLM